MTATDADPDAEPATHRPQGNLRQRTVGASMWSFGAQPASMGLKLLRNLVLAYLLSPAAFGVMALVQVVLEMLNKCSDTGLQPAVIQNERDDADFLNTAWTLKVMRGLIIWLATWPMAWLAAGWYDEPRLLWFIPVAGLSAVAQGLASTAQPTLSRKLDLRTLTCFRLGIQVVNFVLIVGLAWWLRSVWALVIGTVLGMTTQMVVSHTLMPHIRHRFRFEGQATRALISFGGWIFLSTLLTMVATQFDRVVLGKLVGWDMLGLYYVAMMLAWIPKQLGRTVATEVLFPALSEKNRRSPEDLARKLSEARGVMFRLALLMVLGVVFAAPAFFIALYDARYHPAGYIAQWIAPLTWMMIVYFTSTRTLLAVGDSRSLVVTNLVRVLVAVPAALLGYYWGHLPASMWSGYFEGGLTGFVLGLALGLVGSELAAGVLLHRRGLHVLMQDLRWTALGVGLSVLSVGLASLLTPHVPLAYHWVLACIGAIVLIPLGLVFARKTVDQLFPNGLPWPGWLDKWRGRLAGLRRA